MNASVKVECLCHIALVRMLSISVFVLLLTDLVSGYPVATIIGGRDTNIKAHPHQVSLRDRSGYHICGGSIVTRQWVVTAAHCVFDGRPGDFTVSLNAGTLSGGEREVYQVRTIKVLPKFMEGSSFSANDIALINLDDRIELEDGHKIISLASRNQNFTGMTCTITGWGLTNGTDVGSSPNTLQEASGIVLSHSECKNVWKESVGKKENICINNSTSGSCIGDSGGPMICDSVLAGVTSFGHFICNPVFPSVYTRVSPYTQWLKDTMARI